MNIKKSLSIIKKKYENSKIKIEKMREHNKNMKEKYKRSSSSGINRNRFRQSTHSRLAKESHVSVLEKKRLESQMEGLRADLRYLQDVNRGLKAKVKDLQRNDESKNINKRLEAEKSKNLYLENENLQLRKQTRELNSKYKMFIDQKNKRMIGEFINRKSVSSREIEGIKMVNSNLKRENRELKERMQNMGNELKMRSNISEAVSKKEYELDTMRSNLTILSSENNYLKENLKKIEVEMITLKDTLNTKERELSKMNSGNDHMIKMYKKLYNDMKRECENFMDKVHILSLKLQNCKCGNNYTYTKNIYKSKV
jgi:chromosome segregation ATPase